MVWTWRELHPRLKIFFKTLRQVYPPATPRKLGLRWRAGS